MHELELNIGGGNRLGPEYRALRTLPEALGVLSWLDFVGNPGLAVANKMGVTGANAGPSHGVLLKILIHATSHSATSVHLETASGPNFSCAWVSSAARLFTKFCEDSPLTTAHDAVADNDTT